MNRTSKIDPVRFYADLQRAKDLASCASLLKRVMRPFGFNAFACGEVDIDDLNRTVFFVIEWPVRFRKYYMTSGFIDRDPILKALRTRHTPFTWSELRADRELSNLTPEALQHMADNGWTDGLVVPVPRGGSRHGLVSLMGSSKRIAKKQRAALCLICTSFLTRVRSLALLNGHPAPPGGLSKREIDAVRLVARGLSDHAIGRKLGIAASTAHYHVEGARRKLNAKTRAELVAVSVSLGMIDG
jgi:LuxR family quorum sensing-dependent transcriptional regulator